jgi:hypothetical protein
VQGQFASDEKPAKDLARKMFVMVHDLNDRQLKGIGQVSCYTCHRGQVKPALTAATAKP